MNQFSWFCESYNLRSTSSSFIKLVSHSARLSKAWKGTWRAQLVTWPWLLISKVAAPSLAANLTMPVAPMHEGQFDSYAVGTRAVACFFLFNTCYAQWFLSIPFFYPAEITSLRTRSRGVSLSVMNNWLFTFLVVMITPICTTNIRWK